VNGTTQSPQFAGKTGAQEHPSSWHTSTQYELRFARRMARLGTETAFEVLNKAKALERQGKSIIHLEIGEPDFDTPSKT
jgi:hypothetical protein